MKHCRSCRSELEPADLQARSAQTERFRVSIEGIPALRCVRGCPGLYWLHLDLGVDAFDLLLLPLPHFAAIKGFLFWARQACRECGGKLDQSERGDFRFGPDSAARSPLMSLTVNAPTLSCSRCRRRYLPGKLYQGDALQVELDNAISAAMTRDLLSDA